MESENDPQELRERFRRLVNTGQIQFVGGTWVQNDEATVEY